MEPAILGTVKPILDKFTDDELAGLMMVLSLGSPIEGRPRAEKARPLFGDADYIAADTKRAVMALGQQRLGGA